MKIDLTKEQLEIIVEALVTAILQNLGTRGEVWSEDHELEVRLLKRRLQKMLQEKA